MREKGMQINLITYNAAITALSKAAKQSARPQRTSDVKETELWTQVMQLLDQMQAEGIKPDGFSFSSAIACCGAEGRWREALELIELMQKGGPKTRPNKIAFTAAICEFRKRDDLFEVCFVLYLILFALLQLRVVALGNMRMLLDFFGK